jgi:hypothetical protein
MPPSPTGLLVALASLGLVASCSTAASTTGTQTAPTMVSIEPSAFLGSVACSGAPGGLESYVATLVDVTDPDAPFALPSALAAPCSLPVGFYYVVGGHTYTALVDAYDVPASSLVPCGGGSSGARRMLPVGKTDCARDAVAPRWSSACGQGEGTAAVAAADVNTLVRGCDPLVDHGSSPTGVVIDPTATLGSLVCKGENGGDVESFDVTSLDGGLPSITGVACDAPPIAVKTGVEAGRTYDVFVAARAKPGAAPGWGALCHVTAQDGLTVTAACDELDAKGGVRVDVPALFQSAGAACADGAPRVLASGVTVGGAAVDVTTPPTRCDEAAIVGPLPAGDARFGLRAVDASGTTVLTGTCTASVTPGRVATATCSAKP